MNRVEMLKELFGEAMNKAKKQVKGDTAMNLREPIVINFKSFQEVQNQSYQSILNTINDAFNAAKNDYDKMQSLNELGRELVFHTEIEMDKLTHGPAPRKEESTLPEVAS